jgi:hypothetical protein
MSEKKEAPMAAERRKMEESRVKLQAEMEAEQERRELMEGVKFEGTILFTEDENGESVATFNPVEMIPLDDAVEVLAKWICVADSMYTDREAMWEMETDEEKQQYRDAARKELGK